MSQPQYKNKWEKYRKTHNQRVICKDCNISYIKCNKSHHVKNKYHKMIIYCKKVILDHNTFIKNNNNKNMLVNVNGE
jgi:hypothetical protein